MSLALRIKGVQDQKNTILTKMESMIDSDEALDEGQQTQYDDYSKQVGDLNVRLKQLEDLEQLTAKANAVQVPDTNTPVTTTPNEDKTLFYPKMLHSMYISKGDSAMAAAYAKDVLKSDIVSKALQMPPELVQRAAVAVGDTSTSTWATELTTIGQYNSAFIEMLRPMSIVARFPGRQMTFDGNSSIVIPRQTAGVTGGWVAEAGGIKVNKLALDQVTLTPKKNGVIVPVTNELLARSDPSALGLVRDDLLKGIATTIDSKFVSADAAVAGVSPAGIQTYDSSATVSAGDTLDNVTTDIKTVVGALTAINMPMQAPVWIMHPTRVNSLRFFRDGAGQYAFRDEINQGMLAGYPIIESTTITATVVILTDAAQVILATDLAPEISISSDASIHMVDAAVATDIGGGGTATPVASMFQTDSTAIKATTRLDWGARYADCSQVLTACTW